MDMDLLRRPVARPLRFAGFDGAEIPAAESTVPSLGKAEAAPEFVAAWAADAAAAAPAAEPAPANAALAAVDRAAPATAAAVLVSAPGTNGLLSLITWPSDSLTILVEYA